MRSGSVPVMCLCRGNAMCVRFSNLVRREFYISCCPETLGRVSPPKLMCEEHDDRPVWQHQGDEVQAFWLIRGSSK